MSRNGEDRWDDRQRTVVVAPALDGEAGRGRPPAAADRPSEVSLDDVVTAGRAAYCWLDVVVWLRNVTRHHAWDAGASTDGEPGH